MNEITDPPMESAIARREENECQQFVNTSVSHQTTAAQARVESVAATLDAAYRNASTLKLTQEEADALTADFPDEAFDLGAGGDKNLLYLSHVYLRQRLNKVLGIGAVVPIRRREWSEEFTYMKDGRQKRAARVYVDLVLIVRGCVVGEAIGDAIYYMENAQDSYSDTLEKAKSNAFRRCCKEFGVGLQPWMKGFCEAWKQRNRGGPQNARREYPIREQRPAPQNAPPVNVDRPAANPAQVLPAKASEKTREWAWNLLVSQFTAGLTWEFLVSKGWVEAASDDYSTWNLDHVPTSKQALSELAAEIAKCQRAVDMENPEEELPPEWANVIFTPTPKGMKRADWLAKKVTIGQMYRSSDPEDKKRLYGFAKSWNPEPWVGDDGKKRPVSQEDFECRVALDSFLDWRSQRGESGDA